MNGYNFSDASDIRLGSSTITALYYGSTLIWPQSPTPPSPTDWSTEYLQVEALEPMKLYYPAWQNTILSIQYSTDKVNWSTWEANTSEIQMQQGDVVYFKGTYNGFGDGQTGRMIFSNTNNQSTIVSCDMIVRGNVMSLIYGDNFVGQTSLTGYDYCFLRAFSGVYCTDYSNLILPATTLAPSCYSNMFKDSYYIEIAPVLPATTLANECYQYMFADCPNLSTGPSVLPATTLVDRCYASMFSNCSNLTASPRILATTFAYMSCLNMFSHCTSLESIYCLATDISATQCTAGWVQSVAAEGTFFADINSSWPRGVNGVPTDWTIMPVI